MKSDISQQLRTAISQNMPWSFADFFNVLEEFRRRNWEVSYWKDEENWAVILHGNRPITYLWRRYPLAFVEVETPLNIKVLLSSYAYVTLIEVEHFGKNELQIQNQEFEDILDYGIDPGNFSVEDLWFYTNSN